MFTVAKGTKVQRKSDNDLGEVTEVYADGRVAVKCDHDKRIHEYARDTFDYMFRRTGGK
jgi:hypothetical protein